MRLDRTMIAGVVAITIVAAGCSNGTSTSGSSSSQSATSGSQAPSSAPPATTPSSSTQGGSFDQSTCLDISFTKDNLMVAQKPEDARKFADTLEKYGPPETVKAAIEHFVTTVGAQPNDPDLNANRDALTAWIKQVCPNVNP
ncbi:hypothetical protein [Mycobacterium sp. 852014-50255_SCH5639931]|uniref:hypothetical protein n=1 Tax=Mycobacterium sp. 852014-50255_SCH5639931 TaxID=1834112 RepID=UPI0007FDA0E9|nr:hypothetical protein [Mycobacterium sp. 852014-50255_SCH5639931]OBB64120.1 hypothetical protein A5758_01110 [Mycobacterium sp. 852014-50255_SCH5639931]